MASHSPKTVLVVDDDRAVLALLKQWLGDAGYSVLDCDRFEAAKSELIQSAPDVLLTDVRLGAFNGLQLVIVAKEAGPGTAAVVMSAFDDPTLRKDVHDCDASFLPKPFSRDEVLALLAEVTLDDSAATI